MGNPRDRDRLDAWLHAEVEPLAPPPGTFERIRHRARRRKAGRAVMSTAGIVIVVAAAVAVPRIASTLVHSHNGPGRPVAVGGPSSSPRTPTPSRRIESLKPFSGIKVLPATSFLSPQGSGIQVPRNFQPTSVTFVSQSIGAVIGQAGTPGHCAIIPTVCTSLAGTSDYGTRWYGVSAPVTGAPDGASGVSQLRFLNARDGWAFGPELWVTHNGGAHWKQEKTYGMRVTGLETAGAGAFAIFASCTGAGPDYAAHCTSFSLYSSAADSNAWQLVSGPVADLPAPGTGVGQTASGTGAGQTASGTGAGQTASASLVLVGGGTGGGTGYLLAPSGELLSGPLSGGAWTVASGPVVSQHVPCRPGAPGPSGQPVGTLLAANANLLVLACTSATSTASDTQAKLVVESTDGGVHWSTIGAAPKTGIATSVAIQAQDSLVVLATDAGIYLSADGGRTGTWQRTQPSPSGAAPGAAGFSYVGMTSPTRGVALPADAKLHEVYITTDGGSNWQPHAVSGP